MLEAQAAAAFLRLLLMRTPNARYRAVLRHRRNGRKGARSSPCEVYDLMSPDHNPGNLKSSRKFQAYES